MAEFLRRPTEASRSPGGSSPPGPDSVALAYPALAEFLSAEEWDPGQPRTTGTILLCYGDGRYRCWLNDRDSGLTAWLSETGLHALLEAVERGLLDDALEWRKPRPPGRKK